MKAIKKLTFIFAFSIYCSMAFSQPGFSGPTCVLPGVIYQYKIVDASVSTTQLNTRVCLHGGSIVDRNGNRLNDCTKSTEPLATILVMWNDTASGYIDIATSEGRKTLNVNVTSALQAGLVDSLSKEQNFFNTASIPSIIVCSPAKGGSCIPNYSYQWQQSNDAMIWTDIGGSTGQNLSFGATIAQSFFYRRKITETNSGTIGYSDIAVIHVIPFVQNDSSGINGFTGQKARTELPNVECSLPNDQALRFNGNSNGLVSNQWLMNSIKPEKSIIR